MRLHDSTRAIDVRIEFLNSVQKLDKEIESMCEMAQRDPKLQVVRTKRMIMRWFNENGGL